MVAHALERLGEPGHTFEAHVALRERPGGEVDVRVGEPGNDAAPPEIDDVGRGERSLVCSDPAGDTISRDRQRTCHGQRRIHRAHDAVFENHGPRLYPGRRPTTIGHAAVNVLDQEAAKAFHTTALEPH